MCCLFCTSKIIPNHSAFQLIGQKVFKQHSSQIILGIFYTPRSISLFWISSFKKVGKFIPSELILLFPIQVWWIRNVVQCDRPDVSMQSTRSPTQASFHDFNPWDLMKYYCREIFPFQHYDLVSATIWPAIFHLNRKTFFRKDNNFLALS